MLKIKDNVDLKELEKFGFEYFINGCGTYGYSFYSEIGPKGYITIIENDCEFNPEDNRRIPSNITFEILYDLIKADLVEKVDD